MKGRKIAALLYGQPRTFQRCAKSLLQFLQGLDYKILFSTWIDNKGTEECWDREELAQAAAEAYGENLVVQIPEDTSVVTVGKYTEHRPLSGLDCQPWGLIQGLQKFLQMEEFKEYEAVLACRPDLMFFNEREFSKECPSIVDVETQYQGKQIDLDVVGVLPCAGFPEWNQYRLSCPDMLYMIPRNIAEKIVDGFWNFQEMVERGSLEVTLLRFLVAAGVGVCEFNFHTRGVTSFVFREHIAQVVGEITPETWAFIGQVEPLRALPELTHLTPELYKRYLEGDTLEVFNNFDWNNLSSYTEERILKVKKRVV